ncbi:hypothetical protein RCH10_004478 [Variovorax sp. GrIS 2.14]|uniref:PIN domain-containing protein n=1 Tax=Variovorax sp. GrIS 2.14 TaxID=3071709 RepID=UPI0038F69383
MRHAMTHEVHILVDLENVQPPVEVLEALAPGYANAWIFHGPHQTRLSSTFESSIGKRATLVPITRRVPNALDFHLSFYLGYVAAKHPEAHLVVIANDTGYQPMIDHAITLGFKVRRTGYEPPGKPVVARATSATTRIPSSTTAKSATVVVKRAPVKKVVLRKSVKQTPVGAETPAATNASAPIPNAYERLVRAFAKMGAGRPSRKAGFLRHISNMLGSAASRQSLENTLKHLQNTGVAVIEGENVRYSRVAGN